MGNTPGALGDGGQDLTPTTQTAAVPFDELTSLLKVRDDGDGAAATSTTAESDATDSDAVTLPARITDRRHHHHTLEYKRKHAVWDTGVLLVPEVFPTIEDALLNIESPMLSDSSYHKATHRRRHRHQQNGGDSHRRNPSKKYNGTLPNMRYFIDVAPGEYQLQQHMGRHVLEIKVPRIVIRARCNVPAYKQTAANGNITSLFGMILVGAFGCGIENIVIENPGASDSALRRDDGFGVFITAGGTLTLQGCTVRECAQSGIAVNSVSVSMRKNEQLREYLYATHGAAAQVTLVDCVLEDNSNHGMMLCGPGSSARLHGVRCCNNRYGGVVALQGSLAEIMSDDGAMIRGNGWFGCVAEGDRSVVRLLLGEVGVAGGGVYAGDDKRPNAGQFAGNGKKSKLVRKLLRGNNTNDITAKAQEKRRIELKKKHEQEVMNKERQEFEIKRVKKRHKREKSKRQARINKLRLLRKERRKLMRILKDNPDKQTSLKALEEVDHSLKKLEKQVRSTARVQKRGLAAKPKVQEPVQGGTGATRAGGANKDEKDDEGNDIAEGPMRRGHGNDRDAERKVGGTGKGNDDPQEEKLERVRRAQALRAKRELKKYKETLKHLRKDPTNKDLIKRRLLYEEKQKQRKKDEKMLLAFGTNPFNKKLITKKNMYIRQRNRSLEFAKLELHRERRAQAVIFLQRFWRKRRRRLAKSAGLQPVQPTRFEASFTDDSISSSDSEDIQYDDYGKLIIDADTGRPKLKDNSEILGKNNGAVVCVFREPIPWKSMDAEIDELVRKERENTNERRVEISTQGRRSVVTISCGERKSKPADRMFQTGQTTKPKKTKTEQEIAEEKLQCWVDLSGSEFSVRCGPNFMNRGYMVASRDSLYEMETFDVYFSEVPVSHCYARMFPPDEKERAPRIPGRTDRARSNNAAAPPTLVPPRNDLEPGICGVPRRLVFVVLCPLSNDASSKQQPCAQLVFVFRLRRACVEKLERLESALAGGVKKKKKKDERKEQDEGAHENDRINSAAAAAIAASASAEGVKNAGYGQKNRMDVSHRQSQVTRQTLDQVHGLPRSVDVLRRFAAVAAGSTQAVYEFNNNNDSKPLRETMMCERMAMLDRFKFVFDVINMNEAGLGTDDWLFARAVNGRAVLTRPEHSFFAPHDLSYMEVDYNMHAVSPAARARIERLKGRLPGCDVNMALMIEARENDELPEQVLGAVGLRGLNVLDPTLARWPGL